MVVIAGALLGGARLWDIYEDQAVHLQLAWGLLHHMPPYAGCMGETNFPGMLLFHLPFVWMFGSTSLFSYHLQDCLLVLFIIFASVKILVHYEAGPFQCSIFAGCFTASHYLLGPCVIAQREVLAVCLVAFASIPWITRSEKSWPYLISGIFFAGACWVKPVFLFASIVTLPSACEFKWRRHTLCLLGSLIVSASFIVWLNAIGSLGGFYQWCFGITLLGRYTSEENRSLHMLALCLMNAAVVLPTAVALIGSFRYFNTRNRSVTNILPVLLLTAAGLITLLIQRKYVCVNHWLFYIWGLCLLAALFAPAEKGLKSSWAAILLALFLAVATGFKIHSWIEYRHVSLGRSLARALPELRQLRYAALSDCPAFSLFLQNSNQMPGGIFNYPILRHYMNPPQRDQARQEALNQVGKMDVYLRICPERDDSRTPFFQEIDNAYLAAGYSLSEIKSDAAPGMVLARAYLKHPGLIGTKPALEQR